MLAMNERSYLAGFDRKRSKSLRLIESLVTGETRGIEATESLDGQEANVDGGVSEFMEGKLGYGMQLGQ